MMLLLSLRGTPCIYQGEELGLEEADIPLAQMRDPKGIAFYPDPVGRDGCRTPMPWKDTPAGAGFTEGEPWLPIPEAHRAHSVQRQQADPASMLNAVRRMISWRRDHPALAGGALSLIDSPPGVLAFVRSAGNSHLLAAFNLSGAPATLPLADAGRWRILDGHGFAGVLTCKSIDLPPLGACFCTREEAHQVSCHGARAKCLGEDETHG